eukprot:6207587-Pleurochrysis_carterae.AAC.1
MKICADTCTTSDAAICATRPRKNVPLRPGRRQAHSREECHPRAAAARLHQPACRQRYHERDGRRQRVPDTHQKARVAQLRDAHPKSEKPGCKSVDNPDSSFSSIAHP